MYIFAFFLLTLVINNSQPYIFNFDCINESDNGANYNGTINITENGIKCILWKDGPYFTNFIHNYCRNPDSDDKPWCYVSYRPKKWQYCNITYCGYFCPDLKPTEHLIYPTDLVRHKEGDIVHFKCNAGYVLEGNPTSKCHNIDRRQPMAQWSNEQPTCKAVTCSLHNLPSTVVINPRKDHYDLSTSVNLSCTLGYTGTSVRSFCQADKTWSLKAPNCSPVSCRSINLDAHMKSSTKMPKYNDNVTLSCKEGYVGVSLSIKCYANGSWPSDRPHCRPVSCRRINLDAHVKSSTKMPKYNDNVTLSCKEGYVGVSLSIKCYANGSWPSDRPHCRPITCSILKVDDKVLKSKNISKYNDNVTLSCKEGYNGASMTLKCYSNGVWPSQRPNCTAVTCHDLKQVRHQKLEPVQKIYSYRDNVTFKCNDGYELSSKNTRTTCQSDGTWNNKQPNCTGVPCPYLPKIDKALLLNQTKEYRYPETVKITCETGYVVESSDLLQCNSSGFWNYIPQSTCIEKSQSHKDSIENRGKCISYGLFGGILATVVSISAGGHIATCFYYRKRAGKPAAVYEDMQFNTVKRQNSSNEETYTELK